VLFPLSVSLCVPITAAMAAPCPCRSAPPQAPPTFPGAPPRLPLLPRPWNRAAMLRITAANAVFPAGA
jgi:hypothetical protein